MDDPPLIPAGTLLGIHHVRLTVTDIGRSKSFYRLLLGVDPVIDFTDEDPDSGAATDPQRFFGGCTFAFCGQLLGLRPVAEPGDRFDSTRVGLDHLSLGLENLAALAEAARRLDAANIGHDEVTELPDLAIAILSLQDPDDINLELVTELGPTDTL